MPLYAINVYYYTFIINFIVLNIKIARDGKQPNQKNKQTVRIYDKYYFGGETLVRFSIRNLLIIFSTKWFGILGTVIGFFIPNPLSLVV